MFTLVLAGFIFNILRGQPLPELLLTTPRHNYRALHDRDSLLRNAKTQIPTRRKTDRKPSEIPFNTGEGLRAAYYVQDDASSYSSFKQHVHQIDLLFPQWLHVNAPQGTLMAMSSDNLHEYPVIEGNTVHDPDDMNKVKRVIQEGKEQTEIFPHLNNFNPRTQVWDSAIGNVLADAGKRQLLRQQIMRFFAAYPVYRGLSLDIENLDDATFPAYMSFVEELYGDMHPRNLRLYVNTAASTADADLKRLAANSDGVLLMNYDEHEVTSDPGPHRQPELVH